MLIHILHTYSATTHGKTGGQGASLFEIVRDGHNGACETKTQPEPGQHAESKRQECNVGREYTVGINESSKNIEM